MAVVDINGIKLTGSPGAVIVAAYNSTESDKGVADYVCTGSNDQIVIQQAIDSLSEKGGTVYLATGDYMLDGWSYDSNGYKCALCIKNGYQRSVKITGMSYPVRKVNSHDIANSAILRLTDTAIEALAGTETRVSVIGYGGNSRVYPAYVLEVANLGVNLADNQHPIIAIDGKFFSAMFVENVMCAITANAFTSGDGGNDYDYPVDGCIAIRGLEGSNFGAGYRMKNIFVFGYGVAYDINGEHLIAEQLGCRFCNYSYRFGYDATIGYNYHDLTLINCCHEHCSRYPAFLTSDSYKQAINFYDYNVEHATTGRFATVSLATEATNGKNCGRIYFTVSKNSGNASGNFFESGSGSAFTVVNTAYPS